MQLPRLVKPHPGLQIFDTVVDFPVPVQSGGRFYYSLTLCWPSDGKDNKYLLESPGAGVGVGSARKCPIAAHGGRLENMNLKSLPMISVVKNYSIKNKKLHKFSLQKY